MSCGERLARTAIGNEHRDTKVLERLDHGTEFTSIALVVNAKVKADHPPGPGLCGFVAKGVSP